MISRLLTKIKTALKLGKRRVFLYLLHKFKERLGLYKMGAGKIGPWPKITDPKVQSPIFPFPKAEIPRIKPFLEEERKKIFNEAQKIMDGFHNYFSGTLLKRPTNWSSHPQTLFEFSKVHWSLLKSPTAEQGDVKWIWDPARFEWAIPLIHAWALSSDEKFLIKVKSDLEDWAKQNPPNLGIHWKDGQECSLRLIFLIWISQFFNNSDFIWPWVCALAERVEISVGYALSQNNNHGLSESAALWIAGMSLPNHPKCDRWKKKYKRIFETLVTEQFAPDGTYVLHSTNYTREALQIVLIASIAGHTQGSPVDSRVLQRISKCSEFLKTLTESTTGRVSNYGHNDGSHVFNFSNTPFEDFRTVSDLGFYFSENKIFFSTQKSRQNLFWFFGNSAQNFPQISQDPIEKVNPAMKSFKDGGYFIIKSENSRSFGMIRCHSYKTRPSHCDPLHFDLWFGEKNILCDGGTFQYNDSTGIAQKLRSIKSHNTLCIEEEDPMIELGPFLWGDWIESQILFTDTIQINGKIFQVFCGQHFGYVKKFGLIHKRIVLNSFQFGWIIIDVISGTPQSSKGSFSLNWNFGMPLNELNESNSGTLRFKIAELGCQIWQRNTPLVFKCNYFEKMSPYYGKIATCPKITAKGKIGLRNEPVFTHIGNRWVSNTEIEEIYKELTEALPKLG